MFVVVDDNAQVHTVDVDRLSLNENLALKISRLQIVVAQPEMEKRRSPLV